MRDVYLFYKNNWYYNLGSTATGENMYNLPQYNTDIILWKGIDNTIKFSIRDRDRKGFSLGSNKIFLNVINHKLHTKLTKELICLDEYKGLYETTFTQKELKDFEPTFYQASVITVDENNNEDMLYTGVEWNPIFNINIKEGLREVFEPSVNIDINSLLDNEDYYISSKIKADESDFHTASIKCITKFNGDIIIESSVDSNPSDNDWFEIDKISIEEPLTENKTFLFNKQLNCLWIRFKIITNNITNIKEILYRN